MHLLAQAFWLLTELIDLSWLISLANNLWKLKEDVMEKNGLCKRWIDKTPSVSLAGYYASTAWRFTFLFLYLHFNLHSPILNDTSLSTKQTPLILIHFFRRPMHHLKCNFSFSELILICGYIVLFSISAILFWLWYDTVSKRQIIASAMVMDQYFALLLLIGVESWGILTEKSDCQGLIK